MDVESLRSELEQHLGNNPDKDAQDGFRDRFEEAARRYASGYGDLPPSVHEAQLQQIRKDAEAAANAARHGSTGDAETRPPDRTPADARGDEPAIAPGAAPSGDTLKRFGLPIVIILVLIVAALVFFR